MIIETRGDVVRLSGALHKNQWLTIRAAAGMLLNEHPNGIIIDCANLDEVSEDGAKTFLEAMRDIDAAKTRIVVASLPDNVMRVLKRIPGVRSQLPIAESVEAARASLGMHRRSTANPASPQATKGCAVILVPLMAEVDLTYGADLAARVARVNRSEVRLVYLLEVTRTLPLNAPLVEQEQAARESLTKAIATAQPYSVPISEHVERVREAVEGTLAAIKFHQASQVVIGATAEAIGHSDQEDPDRFHTLVETLLHRAPCEVLIGRLRMQQ